MNEPAEARAERTAEILGAALHALEEGIAVLDSESRVVLWSPAAEAISGHLAADLLSRPLPVSFYKIEDPHLAMQEETAVGRETVRPKPMAPERPALVSLRHRQGHSLPAMMRRVPLRDAMGKRFGTLMRFHPVDEIDTLPHGHGEDDDAQDKRVEQGQAEMEDRLDEAWNDFTSGAVPFGILWVNIDQGAGLRKTHGHDASEAMLGIMERTLVHSLRPAETLGRWGAHEFLVLCHERSAEMLRAHAEHLSHLARAADFRWWGDRVSLTLSVGAAHAAEGDSLHSLLTRAQQGMLESSYAGGDRATLGKASNTDRPNTDRRGSGGLECSQS